MPSTVFFLLWNRKVFPAASAKQGLMNFRHVLEKPFYVRPLATQFALLANLSGFDTTGVVEFHTLSHLRSLTNRGIQAAATWRSGSNRSSPPMRRSGRLTFYDYCWYVCVPLVGVVYDAIEYVRSSFVCCSKRQIIHNIFTSIVCRIVLISWIILQRVNSSQVCSDAGYAFKNLIANQTNMTGSTHKGEGAPAFFFA